jgi:ankyrin repeat protein/DNA-directed RNA polymerase subunit RPC12/RpoP
MNILKNLKLFKAVKDGDFEDVAKCLEEGASLNARNLNGWTPLDVAASNGDKEMAALLIAKGADVNGGVALHVAARHGYKHVAEFLIAKGADINAKSKDGDTPIYLAAWKGHQDVVELLIAHGADVNIRGGTDVMGSTPLKIAGDPEVIKLLRKHGAIFGDRNTSPDDMLFESASSGSLDGAAKSLRAGANVNGMLITMPGGNRNELVAPLDVALSQGHVEVARLLIATGAKVSPWHTDCLTRLQIQSKAAAEPLDKQRSGDLVFNCSRCGQEMKELDIARGALAIGQLPVLYDGVRCTSCGKLECLACKGSPADGPCSFCGKSVEPAFERH